MSNNAKVIAMLNQKGGVSKTTTVANLGISLAKLGKKVLVIDFDQQASLTNYLNYGLTEDYYYSIYELLVEIFREDGITEEEDPVLAKMTFEEMIDEVIVRPQYLARRVLTNSAGKREVVNQYEDFGVDLLPSSIDLADFELELTQSRDFARKAYYLQTLVSAIKAHRDYDYILIDCNPSLGVLTMNAIVAAMDGVLIPTNLDLMSVRGVRSLLGKIAETQAAIYRASKSWEKPIYHKGVIGIIYSLYSDKRIVDRELSDQIKDFYPMYIFDAKIPESVQAKKAVLEGLAFCQVYPKAEKAYMDLAREFIKRLDKMEKNNEHNVYYFERNSNAVETINLDELEEE